MAPGTTKAQSSMLPLGRMFEEFMVGMGADTNMAEMIEHFKESGEAPVTGQDFWQATGTEPQKALSAFFSKHKMSDEDESLLLPTFGGYKFNMAD